MRLELFDATCGFGPYRTRVFRSAFNVEELLDEMDFCGTDRALVYHTAQRFDHAPVGNRILLDAVRGEPRLVPTWAVLPSHTGEQPPTEALIEAMKREGVRAVRIFPEDHRLPLDEISWRDRLGAFMDRRIPVFIKASLDKIGSLLRSFPRLVVITGSQGSNPLDRFAFPLAAEFPNLYFETAGYLVDGIIEAFCRRFGAHRLVYSSGYPDHAPGASLLQLLHADISESEKQAIAAGNLRRILDEVDIG